MNIEIKKSFSRDVKKILDKKLLTSIHDIIEGIQQAQSISEIKNIKNMEGAKNHYRIKSGEYRLGLFIDENKTVFIVRFLHRKDIYRYFP
jgi:mRNA interferase RelE/StbE